VIRETDVDREELPNGEEGLPVGKVGREEGEEGGDVISQQQSGEDGGGSRREGVGWRRGGCEVLKGVERGDDAEADELAC
jgi:hypothetical protein